MNSLSFNASHTSKTFFFLLLTSLLASARLTIIGSVPSLNPDAAAYMQSYYKFPPKLLNRTMVKPVPRENHTFFCSTKGAASPNDDSIFCLCCLLFFLFGCCLGCCIIIIIIITCQGFDNLSNDQGTPI